MSNRRICSLKVEDLWTLELICLPGATPPSNPSTAALPRSLFKPSSRSATSLCLRPGFIQDQGLPSKGSPVQIANGFSDNSHWREIHKGKASREA